MNIKYGKSMSGIMSCVATALNGETSMFVTQKGNVVMINEKEYKRLKGKSTYKTVLIQEMIKESLCKNHR